MMNKKDIEQWKKRNKDFDNWLSSTITDKENINRFVLNKYTNAKHLSETSMSQLCSYWYNCVPPKRFNRED